MINSANNRLNLMIVANSFLGIALGCYVPPGIWREVTGLTASILAGFLMFAFAGLTRRAKKTSQLENSEGSAR
jgi:hypothetical protein